MIAFLKGELVETLPTQVVMDVQGVGYEVFVPLSTFEKLPLPPSPAKLYTVQIIRENEHTLYGFLTTEERDLFKLLVANVSGVGPKVAIAMLSGSTPAQFKAAVVQQDTAFLSKIKGVGKKTAERIVVELKDKKGVTEAFQSVSTAGAVNDALLALLALGYKQPDALKAIQKVEPSKAGSTEELVREALKFL